MRLGWIPDKHDARDTLSRVEHTDDFLPKSCDQSQLVAHIFDQGNLGSCTANAGMSVLEAVDFRQTGKRKTFSRLFNYYVTRVYFEGVEPGDDSGATNRNVMKSLARFGACDESLWPYKPGAFGVEPSQAAYDQAERKQALLYMRLPDLYTIKASIAQGFLCTLGFAVPENFMGNQCARDGILHYPEVGEKIEGGHAVTVCGYDDSFAIDGKPGALKIANSWGSGWGRSGFFWMPYSFLENGFANILARDAWTLRLVE